MLPRLPLGSEGRAPSGGRSGVEPPVVGQGEKPPPEADEVFLCLKHLSFNACSIVLHEMAYYLSCFFAHVCGFIVDRVCPLAIAGQHGMDCLNYHH